ncbi:MAG: hypothetical protein HY538_05665 [Deltaproteobacteria bacterium]|nr:hypothetical protein [Deltaproteobacteria bacterium]
MKKSHLIFLSMFFGSAALAQESADEFKTTIQQRWVINPHYVSEGNLSEENLHDAIRQKIQDLQAIQQQTPSYCPSVAGLSTDNLDIPSATSVLTTCLCPGKKKEDLAECLNRQISVSKKSDGSQEFNPSWVHPAYALKKDFTGKEDPNNLQIDTNSSTKETFLEQLLQKGEGEPYRVLNSLGAFPTQEATSDPLSFFFMGHWTDCQLIDEFSPARLTAYDNIVSSSHEPGEDTFVYACATLIGTMNRFMEETGRSFDMLAHTGDYIDTGEEIELRWSLAATHGGEIEPCTGFSKKEAQEGKCTLNRDEWMEKNLQKFQWTKGSDQPFMAEGLNLEVPHLYMFGNHDGLVTGNFAKDDERDPIQNTNHLLAHQIGSFVTSPESCEVSAYGYTYSEAIKRGTNFIGFNPIDLTLSNVLKFFGSLIQCARQTVPDFNLADIEIPEFEDRTDITPVLDAIQGMVALASTESTLDRIIEAPGEEIGMEKVFVGYDDRRSLLGAKYASSMATYDFDQRKETIKIIFEAGGENKGGFKHSQVYNTETGAVELDEIGNPMHCNESIAQEKVANLACSGFYAFDCLEDSLVNTDSIPLRCIAIDTLGNGSTISEGAATEIMLDFLVDELDRAKAEKKLVLGFSHHGPESFFTNNLAKPLGLTKADYPESGCSSDGCALVHLFQQYDNFIAWIYGHGHRNLITAWPNSEKPGFGFWSIQTAAAGIAWPQVARTLEFVDLRNGVGAIVNTVIEHYESTENRPSYEGGHPSFDNEDLQKRGLQMAYHSRLLAAWDALMGEHLAFAYGRKKDSEGKEDKTEVPTVQILTVTDSSRTRLSQEGAREDRNVILLFQFPEDIAQEFSQITNAKPLTYLELDFDAQNKIDQALGEAPTPAPGEPAEGSPTEPTGESEEEGCGCQVIGGATNRSGMGSLLISMLLFFTPWVLFRFSRRTLLRK